MSQRHGSAVVIGASIGGLLAARALSSHFDRVTIVGAASDDPVICRRFFNLLNLLAPPASLMAPGVMFRVLARRAPRDAGTPWGTITGAGRESAAAL